MAQNEIELKPCPFCGGEAEMETMPDVRTILRCTNTRCYLHFNPWRSYNCGDTDEHARLRLSTWWNMRADITEKEKPRKQLCILWNPGHHGLGQRCEMVEYKPCTCNGDHDQCNYAERGAANGDN